MRPLVIVPTYNERANLARASRAAAGDRDFRVLIVDDASPDGTGQIADGYAAANRARVQVLHRTGQARTRPVVHRRHVRARCERMPRTSARWTRTSRMIRLTFRGCSQAAEHADFVIGSRYVAGGRIENWPLHRRLLSAFANRYIRAITRMAIRDCTSGFRCWRREALERLPLASIRSDGYAFIVELAWEASRAGLRCAEVPITFVERRAGRVEALERA